MNKKQILNSQDIKDYINNFFVNYKKGFYVSIVLSIILFIISLPLLFFSVPIYALLMLPGVFLVIAIGCLVKSNLLFNKKYGFYIEQDCCYSTREGSRSDEGVLYDYYISFNKYGCHKLTDILQSKEEIYEKAQPGDMFYLVFLNRKKKPFFVISQKEYEIDKTQFIKREDRYYPI